MAQSGSEPVKGSPLGWALLGPVLAGIVIGLVSVQLLFGFQETQFEDVGLGVDTTAVHQNYGGRIFHCESSVEPCIESGRNVERSSRVLWLGASQLYGVNAYRPGDKTAPWLLHDNLREKGVDLVAVSMPNANFQELYVLFEHLRQKLGFDTVVLGAVLDDMREPGIRQSVARVLETPEMARTVARAPVGRVLLKQSNPEPARATPGGPEDLGALAGTVQEKAETELTEWLSDVWPLWATRAEARGQAILWLKLARYRLLGLRNRLTGRDWRSWQVPMPEAQYRLNWMSLEALSASAREAGVQLVIYVAPRPIDWPFPYDAGLYARYKSDLAELAGSAGHRFVNLEDAVLGDVWGLKEMFGGELGKDIFHFKADGHSQFAGALIGALEPFLSEDRR